MPKRKFSANLLAHCVPWLVRMVPSTQVFAPGKRSLCVFSLSGLDSWNGLESHPNLHFQRRWQSFSSSPIPRLPKDMRQNLYRSVEEIALPLENISSNAFISNVIPVASYNWLHQRSPPTILIPGHPNIWLGPELPLTLQSDAGKIFIDQNAYQLPKFPLLPLLAATKAHSPEFSLPLMDFITDLRVLMTLWQWASEEKSSAPLGPRRIDIEMVGDKTVLMQHWTTPKTSTKIVKSGFANEFNAASTKPAPILEEAYGHYRIISYTLGDLRILLRYRVDACLGDSGPRRHPNPTSPHAKPFGIETPVVSMDLQGVGRNNFRMERRGNFVQQSSLVKLEVAKTSRLRELEDDWTRIYPESLLSQVSNIYMCLHSLQGDLGVFSRVNRMNLGAVQLRYAQNGGRGSLAKLHAVLVKIKETLIAAGSETKLTLILSHHSPSIVIHRKVDLGSLIPTEAMSLFKT